MPHAFAERAFTPAVKAAQVREGSRAAYARGFEGGAPFNDALGPDERAFVEASRSAFLATVSETGWPYVQHRGGPVGFLKVLDPHTIAFADYAGSRQLVSVGNVEGNDRVALILVDYAQRARLKLLGRLSVREVGAGDAEVARLHDPAYPARVQRVMTIHVEAIDWNCSKHIPVRFEAEDVQRALDERDAVIASLRARVAALEKPGAAIQSDTTQRRAAKS